MLTFYSPMFGQDIHDNSSVNVGYRWPIVFTDGSLFCLSSLGLVSSGSPIERV
jgi:hypothetical protein